MKKILFRFSIAAIALSASCSDYPSEVNTALKDGFADPPRSARAKVYWWWLNGYVDSVRVKEELRAIKDAGLGGVDIFEIGVPPDRDPNQIIPAGPAFMSEQSLRMIKLAIEEAGNLILKLVSAWPAAGTPVEAG
jgi:hypothetical protein